MENRRVFIVDGGIQRKDCNHEPPPKQVTNLQEAQEEY